MGGYVGVTIREENGTEHRLGNWTNSMPHFVVNIGLLDKDPEHLKDFLSWPRERSNTPHMAPHDYGLIVIDYQKEKILTLQGYTSFDHVDGILLKMDMQAGHKDSHGVTWNGERMYADPKKAFFETEHPDHCARLRPFCERGKVSARRWNPDKQEYELLQEKVTVDDIVRMYEEQTEYLVNEGEPDDKLDTVVQHDGQTFRLRKNPNEFSFLDFFIDWSPFEIIRYEEDSAGVEAFHQKVLELGFKLSDEEERLWKEFADRRREFEEEDAELAEEE